MLQQTTVATVLPYYERWMAQFPTVHALACANEVEVLSAWQGLGYYRRARNLHTGAQKIASEGWPSSFHEWKSVPGVGKYTAGAIASIVLKERVPAVDGNVERVCARVTASLSDADTWARSLADCPRPGDVNQALMDLGATVCRPKNPDCARCPLRGCCAAHESGTQSAHPRPKRRADVVIMSQSYSVPVCAGAIGVRRFGADEWWSGLYGFPLCTGTQGVKLGTVRMTVTNHRISATAYLEPTDRRRKGLRWLNREDLDAIPMPAPHRRILALLDSTEEPA